MPGPSDTATGNWPTIEFMDSNNGNGAGNGVRLDHFKRA